MEGHLLSPTAMERHWIRATYIPSSSWHKGSYLSVLIKGSALWESQPGRAGAASHGLILTSTSAKWLLRYTLMKKHNKHISKERTSFHIAVPGQGGFCPPRAHCHAGLSALKQRLWMQESTHSRREAQWQGEFSSPVWGEGQRLSSPTHRVSFRIGPLFFPSLPINLLPVCPCHSRT